MKSCNDRDILPFLFQYLFCHIRGGSMRDSIMYMEKVEVIIFNDIHHGTRQGCFIGWVIKQWIRRDLHLVVKNIGSERAQSYRLLVGYEMYLVSFLRQRFS